MTVFADVGGYSKPQPSLMQNVDSTLRQIAQVKFLIATDLTYRRQVSLVGKVPVYRA